MNGTVCTAIQNDIMLYPNAHIFINQKYLEVIKTNFCTISVIYFLPNYSYSLIDGTEKAADKFCHSFLYGLAWISLLLSPEVASIFFSTQGSKQLLPIDHN